MNEFGIAQAQPVVNPTTGKIADLLRQAKTFGNQYEIKDYVPFFGGTGLGDLFLGQAPEEVDRWRYGDYPFRNPASVVPTGGNRLDVWKAGRFEPTFDVLANVALPAAGTTQLAGRTAKALGPKAGQMAENYMVNQGFMPSVVPPSPAKIAEALRQPPKNDLGFYSPLDEAVLNLQNPKGTGQQYLAQLLKTQGVKQEEVSTRGLDTFLTENPKVTREQMAQYLRENPVELKETVLGAGGKRQMDSMSNDDYSLGEGRVLDDPDYVDNLAQDEFYFIKNEDPDLVEHYRTQAFDDLEIDPMTADPSDLSRVDDLTDDYIRDAANIRAQEMYDSDPYFKFEDDLGYTVTGSDNVGYTITDPNGREVPTPRNGIYNPRDAEDLIREDALDRGFLHYADDEYGTKYHDYTLPNGENYREVLIQYPQKPASVKEMSDGKGFMAQGSEGSEPIYGKTREEAIERWQNSRHAKNYQSGHFDEPNILAHFRTTDRTIDGKKTLFVEEIQSDWHQQGRKQGYKSGQNVEKQYEDLMLGMKKQVMDEKYNMYKKIYEDPQDGAKLREMLGGGSIDELAERSAKTYMGNLKFDDLAREAGKYDEWKKLYDDLAVERHGVPDAPFKKNWQELAMKRAMQMAAEGGYQRVAFTTGKQQAERYNLSKQVDQINWMPYESNGSTKVVRIQPKNGNTIELRLSPEGKVMNGGSSQFADKSIDEVIGKDIAKKIMDENNGDLSGLGLDIGGEGMKGFYDKILPDFINKYGKKHGLKTGKTALVPPDQAYLLRGSDGHVITSVKTKEKAEQYIKDMTERDPSLEGKLSYEKGRPEEDVHYFDLTPEAKESFISKGQPMFAAAPLALTDEDTRREMLEKLFNNSGN